MTSTTTETAPAATLTSEQQAEIFRLSVLPYGTILRDTKFGQVWQIGRVQKKDRETLADLGNVPVMSTIGSTDTYELTPGTDPDNDAMLLELLDGTTYEVVPTVLQASSSSPVDPIQTAAQRAAEHFAKGALLRVDPTLAGMYIGEHARELLGETDAEYYANCAALSACVRTADLTVTVSPVPVQPDEQAIAKAYAWFIGPLAAAGTFPYLRQTGGPGCYVIRIDLADGTLIEIGSDTGPLAHPGKTGARLKAVWYAGEESTSSQGDLVGTARRDTDEIPALVEEILSCVVSAKKAQAPAEVDETIEQRLASVRKYVSRTRPQRTAVINFVTPDTIAYELYENNQLAGRHAARLTDFDAEFQPDEQPGVGSSRLITFEEQDDSRYHIETSGCEAWSASRRAAVGFAKMQGDSNVWDTQAPDVEDGLKRIYWAEPVAE